MNKTNILIASMLSLVMGFPIHAIKIPLITDYLAMCRDIRAEHEANDAQMREVVGCARALKEMCQKYKMKNATKQDLDGAYQQYKTADQQWMACKAIVASKEQEAVVLRNKIAVRYVLPIAVSLVYRKVLEPLQNKIAAQRLNLMIGGLDDTWKIPLLDDNGEANACLICAIDATTEKTVFKIPCPKMDHLTSTGLCKNCIINLCKIRPKCPICLNAKMSFKSVEQVLRSGGPYQAPIIVDTTTGAGAPERLLQGE